MNLLKCFFCFFLCVIVFSACNKKKLNPKLSNQEVLSTALGYEPLSLDPRKGFDVVSQSVLRSLFVGLVYLDKDLHCQLDLASSYTISKDFRTYTFYLRDCRWSDGSVITAKDFEETWKSTLTPQYVSPFSHLLYLIKNGQKVFLKECSPKEFGAKATNDTTLVVELEYPNPNFLNVLAHSVFFPVHQSLRDAKQQDGTQMVTSGPFVVETHQLQNKIILAKNHHFWDAKHITLKKLSFLIVQDPQTALMMFEKKDLDFLSDVLIKISADVLPDLQRKQNLHWTEVAGTQWLLINTHKFPLNNKNIRKALAYAINRKSLIDHVLHLPHQTPPTSLIPKGMQKGQPYRYFEDHNLDQAQRYLSQGLKELNITQDQLPEIVISFAGGNIAIPQAIEQMWTQTLGWKARCQNTDMPIFIHDLNQHDYQIARMGWVAPYNDPVTLLENFSGHRCEPNYTGWNNEKYSVATTKAKSCSPEKKWSYIEEAEKIFFDEMPAIPLAPIAVFCLNHSHVYQIDINALLHISFRNTYLK